MIDIHKHEFLTEMVKGWIADLNVQVPDFYVRVWRADNKDHVSIVPLEENARFEHVGIIYDEEFAASAKLGHLSSMHFRRLLSITRSFVSYSTPSSTAAKVVELGVPCGVRAT